MRMLLHLVAYCFAPVAGYSSFGSLCREWHPQMGRLCITGMQAEVGDDTSGLILVIQADWWMFTTHLGKYLQ
jgi:hypothetical protein